jgi:hypothetical protein
MWSPSSIIAASRSAKQRRRVPFAYSFIVTDILATEKTAVEAEYLHRQRAQIEQRFKDARLGQALRHLGSRQPPSSNQHQP